MSKSVENLHESFPSNRNMAHALYRSTFLENWSGGIHRIIEACQEQGVEEPTWCWDDAFVYVTFKRPSYKPLQKGNTLMTIQGIMSLKMSFKAQMMSLKRV